MRRGRGRDGINHGDVVENEYAKVTHSLKMIEEMIRINKASHTTKNWV